MKCECSVLVRKPDVFNLLYEERENNDLHCHNCKAVVEKDAKFCASCQAPIAQNGLIECPNCNESIAVTARFCKYCSTKIFVEEELRSLGIVDSSKRKGNTLAVAGAILATASGIAFFWGMNFTSNWANKLNAGFGQVVTGQVDSTYQLAQACVALGAIGIIVGIVLFIVGLAQR